MTIRGYSKTDGKELLYLEQFWRSNKEFKEDPRVNEVVEGGFLGYEENLSAEAVRQMHEHFKPYVNDVTS